MLDLGHMWLLIGPLVLPIPAPLPVVEALQSVEVTSSRDRSGFQLTLTLGKASPLQLAMLPLGYFDPMITRVVILVVVRGIPQVIMDGVVTRQENHPGNEPGQSTLTITGEDLSVLMDVFELRIPYPAMLETAQIYSILGRYGMYRIVPDVRPPLVSSVDVPTNRFDSQDGTDREHIRMLARRTGYAFYIEPGPLPGQSIAYFGPDIRIPAVQPALKVNMDAETNVEQLTFSFDGLAARTTVMTVFDPITGKIPIPIPVPSLNPLRPPLGVKPAIPAHVTFTEDTSHLNPTDAAQRAFGIMMDSAPPVTGNGTLNVGSYGQPLRARMLVGVSGAGISYDGFYFVDSVTHNIKPGEYKQSFQLSRDGLISQTPVVVP